MSVVQLGKAGYGPCFWWFDTDASKPAGGYRVGDLVWCTDTKKLFVATATSALHDLTSAAGGGIADPGGESSGDLLKYVAGVWSSGRADWTELTGKPATFAPAAHTHTEADVTGLVTDLAAKQPLAAALTTLAGLTATTDNFLVGAASAWASRTPAQAKTSLALAKADVGLASVDDTADAAKPVSTAQQTALDAKEATANKGVANGYASLGADGLVPAAQLPAAGSFILTVPTTDVTVPADSSGVVTDEYVMDATHELIFSDPSELAVI